MERTSHSYFVVMIDYPNGREAIVDPEMTRRDVVARIYSGEYRNISFIHFISMNEVPTDVTTELMDEAACSVLQAAE